MDIYHATDIAHILSPEDLRHIADVSARYEDIIALCKDRADFSDAQFRARLITGYEEIGAMLKKIVQSNSALSVYSFNYPNSNHGEVSRIVAKLRDVTTKRAEFLYYTQRAFELLFSLAFASDIAQRGKLGAGGQSVAGTSAAAAGASTTSRKKRTHMVVRTPVNDPVPAYAVHRIPDVDEEVKDTVMCVLLRGALLPSIIVSKEIEEFSSRRYVTPFALFKIKRDDTKTKNTMRYIIDPAQSYFNPRELDGKHLVFPDPMNATAGSLLAVMAMLSKHGVTPARVTVMSIISSLEGLLRAARGVPNCTCHTLWLDPVLNDKAYILPGLGDAGDRINGPDTEESPRKILRLLADFGHMHGLYAPQFAAIEHAVLPRT